MNRINQAAVDEAKKWEGLRLKAYKDIAGVWTIGYGTTARAGLGIEPKAGMVITEAEAEYYLQKGLQKFAGEIAPLIKVPLNDNQFGALVLFAYNIGTGGFRGSSTLRHLNNGDYERACNNMALWNKITKNGRKVVSKGLQNRRAAEQALFRTPVKATPPETKNAPQGGFWALLRAILKGQKNGA